MPGGKNWLYRPLDAGYIKYESLLDGTIGLWDIAEMNDLLSIRDENDARAHEAARNR